jgi:quercetin dioxygenase-like cupin family protein
MESITWSDVPADEVYPGISRQILHGERQTMVRYVYAPGSIFPIHSHPEEQVTIVISGEIEFTIDGEPVELRAGQAAVIPANMPHGAKVIGKTTVETFNALSPRRERQPAPSPETGN